MQLLRTTATALAVTALVMMLGGSARAQEGWPNKPFRLKIGGFIPYDSDTRDALGTHFLSFGAGYDFKHVSSFLPATLEGYVDYFDRPKTTADFGRVEARSFAVGVAARFSLIKQPSTFNPYIGAGLGFYYSRFKVDGPDGASASTNRASVGGKFFTGAELKNGIFGEVEFDFLPHPSVFGSDQVLSGLQARLGYRF